MSLFCNTIRNIQLFYLRTKVQLYFILLTLGGEKTTQKPLLSYFLSKHFVANLTKVSTQQPQSTANASLRPAFKWEALFTDPLGVSHLGHHRVPPYLMTEESIIPLFSIPVTGARELLSVKSPEAQFGIFICFFSLIKVFIKKKFSRENCLLKDSVVFFLQTSRMFLWPQLIYISTKCFQLTMEVI